MLCLKHKQQCFIGIEGGPLEISVKTSVSVSGKLTRVIDRCIQTKSCARGQLNFVPQLFISSSFLKRIFILVNYFTIQRDTAYLLFQNWCIFC